MVMHTFSVPQSVNFAFSHVHGNRNGDGWCTVCTLEVNIFMSFTKPLCKDCRLMPNSVSRLLVDTPMFFVPSKQLFCFLQEYWDLTFAAIWKNYSIDHQFVRQILSKILMFEQQEDRKHVWTIENDLLEKITTCDEHFLLMILKGSANPCSARAHFHW